MPRQPRYFVPGVPQHVVARGVNKGAVFFGPRDYSHYIEDLRTAASTYGCAIHAYVLTCQRYIEMNPVRAGLARLPGDYAYSSFASNAYGAANSLLTRHPVYEALHHDPSMRPRAYRRLFRDHFSNDELHLIRKRTNACSFLGDERFKARLESTLGRALTTGLRGRPPKKSV